VNPQIKAPKSKAKQAIPHALKTSINEVPKSIFSFPKDTAWAFTVSTTPCNDRGIARAIRSHAGVKNRNNSYLGELDFFSKNGRRIIQMTDKEENTRSVAIEPFRRCCTALKQWALQEKIKSIPLPRLSRRSDHTGWVTNKGILSDTFRNTNIEVWLSKGKGKRKKRRQGENRMGNSPQLF